MAIAVGANSETGLDGYVLVGKRAHYAKVWSALFSDAETADRAAMTWVVCGFSVTSLDLTDFLATGGVPKLFKTYGTLADLPSDSGVTRCSYRNEPVTPAPVCWMARSDFYTWLRGFSQTPADTPWAQLVS